MSTFRLTTNGGVQLEPAAPFADTQLAILRHYQRWPVYLRQHTPRDMPGWVVTFQFDQPTTCSLYGVDVSDRRQWPDFAQKFATAVDRATTTTKKEPQLT